LTGSLFRGIIPEKYRYFSGNFRKNSAGNFRKFPNSQPYLLQFIENWLSDTKQRVVLNNSFRIADVLSA